MELKVTFSSEAIGKAGGQRAFMTASNNCTALPQAKGPTKPVAGEAVTTAGPQQIQVLMDEVTKQV